MGKVKFSFRIRLQEEIYITKINLFNFAFENRKVIYELDRFRDIIPQFLHRVILNFVPPMIY